MKVNLGLSVWYRDRLTENDYSRISDAGIKYIELSLDHVWPFRDQKGFEREIKKIKDNGLSFGVHLPWRDIVLLSPYEELRRASASYLIRVADDLSKYEAQYAVLHISTYETVNRRDLELLIKDGINTITTVAKSYKESGIDLLLENLPRGPLSNLYILEKMAREAKSDVCLDFGHLIASMVHEKEKVNVKDILEVAGEWIRRLGLKIRLTHIHGVIKVDKNLLEHYLLDDYYDVYASLIRKIVEETGEANVTIEVFYRDPNRRAAGPKILIKNSLKLLEALKNSR